MTRTNKLLAGLAAAAAFGTAFAIVGMSQARAADLGGNCCADLEERVAELEATTARKGNRKMMLTVYGQVNYGILSVDADGHRENTISNNTNSMTRFGFKGQSKISADMSAGFLLEVGTSKGEGTTGVADSTFNVRHSAIWLGNDTVGKVWLGKTSTATDGIAEISLARIEASTMLSFEPLSGAYLGGFGTPFDGPRSDVVKFESGSLAGFKAAASYSTNDSVTGDAWDMALRYAGELGGFNLGAGIGYRHLADDGGKGVMGSVSVMHVATGLFANGAWGKMTGDNVRFVSASSLATFGGYPLAVPFSDPKAWHVQAGIERNWFGPGKTTAYGEYLKLDTKAYGTIDVGVTAWGLGLNQEISAAAMDLYVGYRSYSVDVGPGKADFNTIIAGAVVKF